MKIKAAFAGVLLFAAFSTVALADTNVTVDGNLSEWPDDGWTFEDGDDMGWLFGHRDVLNVWATDNNSGGDDGYLFVAFEFQNTFRTTYLGVDIDVFINIDGNGDGDFDDPEDRVIEVTEEIIQDGDGNTVTWSGGETFDWAFSGRFLEVRIPYAALGISYGNDTIGIGTYTNGYPNITDDAPEEGVPPIVYDGTSGIEPLSVKLLRLDAHAGRGGVTISWQTATERRNAGFMVFREEADGRFAPVTRRMIPGKLDSPFGGTYSVLDPRGIAGDRYQLMDIEVAGRRTSHPVVVASTVAPKPLEQVGLRAAPGRVGRLARVSPFPAALPITAKAPHAATQLKLCVDEPGLQRVDVADLAAAGLPVSGPKKVRLEIDGSQVRTVGDGGDLLFWATPTRDRYADYDVAFARKGAEKKMAAYKVTGSCASPASAVRHTVTAEEQALYYVATPTDDPLFWTMTLAGYLAALPFEAPLPSDGTAIATVRLAGAAFLDELEHFATVSLNGTVLGETAWAGDGLHEATFSFSADLLADGANALEVSLTDDMSTDVIIVDGLEVDYPRSPIMDAGALVFRAAAADCVEVEGATGEVLVLRVNEGQHPRLVEGYDVVPGPDGDTIVIGLPKGFASGENTFAVIEKDLAAAPGLIGPRVAPSDFGEGAEYVVITPPSMLAAATAMADYRESTGKSVAVITTEEIYDTWGDGRPHPRPIRDFLEDARASWSTPPRFVLLMGGSTVDGNDYLGTGAVDFVPTHFHVGSASGYEAAADGWYVGQEGAQGPWAAIGRLAARSPEEAEETVEKLIAWFDLARPPLGAALFVADRDAAATAGDNPFELAASDIIEACFDSDIEAVRMDLDTQPSAAAALFEVLTAGVDAVSFHGHAYVSGWSTPQVMNLARAQALANDHLFIALSWSCFDGSFVGPWGDSLSWELVANPAGGAYSAVSSSSLTEPFAADILSQELMCLIATNGSPTIGEALLEAKGALVGADDELNDVLATYNLLGDPAAPSPWTMTVSID